MSKLDDILDYVEETPHNTNRKLLKNMLTEFQESDNLTLPEVTEDDNGDVLMVVNGEWGKGEPVTELPEVTSLNNGEVLTVVEGEWGRAQPSTELPAVTGTDNGNVLAVDNGAWTKKIPEIIIIPITYDADSGEYNSTYEYSDIINLISSKKEIIIRYVNTNENNNVELYLYDSLNYQAINFAWFDIGFRRSVTKKVFTCTYDDYEQKTTWSYNTANIKIVTDTIEVTPVSGQSNQIEVNANAYTIQNAFEQNWVLLGVYYDDSTGTRKMITFESIIDNNIAETYTITARTGSTTYAATVTYNDAYNSSFIMTET